MQMSSAVTLSHYNSSNFQSHFKLLRIELEKGEGEGSSVKGEFFCFVLFLFLHFTGKSLFS